MAVNPLPDVPFKSPVLDSRGFLTQVWSAWFRELFTRVGKNVAPTNTDLQGIVDAGVPGIAADIAALESADITQTARIVIVEGGITQGRQL